MAVSAAQAQALILDELALTGDAAWTARVATWWEFHEEYQHTRLRYLYTKLAAIDKILMDRGDDVNVAVGTSREDAGQAFEHWEKLRQGIQGEIDALLAQLRSRRGPVVSTMTTTAPVTVTTPPDPNDRAYRGDPLRRSYP